MTYLKTSTAILAETDPDEQASAVDELVAERDRYRHALSVIANARADHVAAGLIYTARKALGRE